MNREDRAKQFAPFEALTGLREVLRQKEREFERINKNELSDDGVRAVQDILAKVCNGDFVELICYKNGQYITYSGRVIKKDTVYKNLVFAERKIFFDDIYKIDIKKHKNV